MKKLISLFLFLIYCAAHASLPVPLLVNTNGVIVWPSNFKAANSIAGFQVPFSLTTNGVTLKFDTNGLFSVSNSVNGAYWQTTTNGHQTAIDQYGGRYTFESNWWGVAYTNGNSALFTNGQFQVNGVTVGSTTPNLTGSNAFGTLNGTNVMIGGFSISLDTNDVYLSGFNTATANGIYFGLSATLKTNLATASYIKFVSPNWFVNNSAGQTMYLTNTLFSSSWLVGSAGSAPAGSSVLIASANGPLFLGGTVVATNGNLTGITGSANNFQLTGTTYIGDVGNQAQFTSSGGSPLTITPSGPANEVIVNGNLQVLGAIDAPQWTGTETNGNWLRFVTGTDEWITNTSSGQSFIFYANGNFVAPTLIGLLSNPYWNGTETNGTWRRWVDPGTTNQIFSNATYGGSLVIAPGGALSGNGSGLWSPANSTITPTNLVNGTQASNIVQNGTAAGAQSLTTNVSPIPYGANILTIDPVNGNDTLAVADPYHKSWKTIFNITDSNNWSTIYGALAYAKAGDWIYLPPSTNNYLAPIVPLEIKNPGVNLYIPYGATLTRGLWANTNTAAVMTNTMPMCGPLIQPGYKSQVIIDGVCTDFATLNAGVIGWNVPSWPQFTNLYTLEPDGTTNVWQTNVVVSGRGFLAGFGDTVFLVNNPGTLIAGGITLSGLTIDGNGDCIFSGSSVTTRNCIITNSGNFPSTYTYNARAVYTVAPYIDYGSFISTISPTNSATTYGVALYLSNHYTNWNDYLFGTTLSYSSNNITGNNLGRPISRGSYGDPLNPSLGAFVYGNWTTISNGFVTHLSQNFATSVDSLTTNLNALMSSGAALSTANGTFITNSSALGPVFTNDTVGNRVITNISANTWAIFLGANLRYELTNSALPTGQYITNAATSGTYPGPIVTYQMPVSNVTTYITVP